MSEGEDANLHEGRDKAAPLLVLEAVRRDYRMGDQTVAALDGIDLAIHAGEFVAIVGPSGSGKSTLLNIIGCLDTPSGGSYKVAGHRTMALDSDSLAALRRRMFGFVFQGYNLLPRLSARMNVETPAIYDGLARKPRRTRAEALLARLGLDDRFDHRPTQLSGGQQQRVSLARALINGGTVILADEPTGALDLKTGDEILALFRELRDEGHTIIIVSHDMRIAAQADRVIEIADGRIIADRILRDRIRISRPSIDEARPRDARYRQFSEALVDAVRTMSSHRLRNFLTLLGVVVGIAAVILSVAIGEGSQKQVLRQISGLGNDIVDVFPGNLGSVEQQPSKLGMEEVRRFSEQPFITGASPYDSTFRTLRSGDKAAKVQVWGVSTSFFRIEGASIVAGRDFTANAIETLAPQLVIGATTRSALFAPGEDPIGAVVFVGNMPARIVGVVDLPQGQLGIGLFAALPYSTYAYRLLGRTSFTQLHLKVDERVDRPVAVAAIGKLLRAWHGRDDFFLSDTTTIRDAILRTRLILNFVTTSIATIALFVGGIGVTNMMLVSVAERTREIGILMAIGARRADIRTRIMIEAVILCLGGGAAGTLLAYGVGMIIQAFHAPVDYEFSWRAVMVAVVTSTVAGLAAGVFPAQRAARINPVEALAR